MFNFLPSLLCLSLLFVWCSQGVLVIENVEETFSNTDFFLMPNNYSLFAPLFKPRWLEGNCQLDTEDPLPQGNLLFFDWTEAEDHGCRFIHEVITGIELLSPAVSIFSSKNEASKGDLNNDPYGYYFKYRYSGLSLTFVGAKGSDRLRELFLQSSNFTCFVSHDEGDWVRFRDSPEMIAHIAVCISLLSLAFLFIITRLAMLAYTKTLDLKVPTLVYICSIFFCIFKILDLAIDPFSLYGRIPLWLRYFFYWIAYAFGYSAFALIGISWVKIATSINLKAWHQTFALHLTRYSYFTIFYWGGAVLGFVLFRQFSDTAMGNLSLFFYLTLIPMVVINSVILLFSGARILLALKKNPLGINPSRETAFKRITLLLLFSVIGFFGFMIVMALHYPRDYTIAQVMTLEWLRELFGIGLLISILLALKIQPSQQGSSMDREKGPLGSNTGGSIKMEGRPGSS